MKRKTLVHLIGLAVVLTCGLNALAEDKPPEVDRPFETRKPPCVSLFLKEDFQFSTKQKFCDLVQNRIFTLSAAFSAAFSAGYSQITERSQDRGKGTTGYSTRFSEDFAQSAFKSTGALLGGFVFREDPRPAPPYLVLKGPDDVHGFWRRTGRGLGKTLLSYRCINACTSKCDIKRTFALSHLTGAFASGFSSELWAPDRLNDPGRALRRSASAYGASFGSNLFSEFKPELSAAARKVLSGVFGIR